MYAKYLETYDVISNLDPYTEYLYTEYISIMIRDFCKWHHLSCNLKLSSLLPSR